MTFSPRLVAKGKQIDLVVQILTLPFMMFLMFRESLGPFAMYAMAAIQVLGCLVWIPVTWNTAKMQSRSLLQIAFPLIAALLIIILCISSEQFMGISFMVMTWLGPVLGIWYFILTANEISFYKSLIPWKTFE